jgi:hypothetical protein
MLKIMFLKVVGLVLLSGFVMELNHGLINPELFIKVAITYLIYKALFYGAMFSLKEKNTAKKVILAKEKAL